MNGKCIATLNSITNRAIVYDICFYPDTKASHTLHFLVELGPDTGTHVYVDMNDRGPIAFSLVHSPSANIIYSEVQSLSPNFVERAWRFCRHLVEIYNPTVPTTGKPRFAQKVTNKRMVSDFANIGFEFEARNVKQETG